jgi:hypothetical protein
MIGHLYTTLKHKTNPLPLFIEGYFIIFPHFVYFSSRTCRAFVYLAA